MNNEEFTFAICYFIFAIYQLCLCNAEHIPPASSRGQCKLREESLRFMLQILHSVQYDSFAFQFAICYFQFAIPELLSLSGAGSVRNRFLHCKLQLSIV